MDGINTSGEDEASPNGQWEYWYGCEDVAGRPSKGAVIWRDGAIHLTVPSPGTAVFGVGDVDQLAHLLMSVTIGLETLRREESRNELGGRGPR